MDPVPDPAFADPADPAAVWTQQDMPTVLGAYDAFGRRDAGWTKVALGLGG